MGLAVKRMAQELKYINEFPDDGVLLQPMNNLFRWRAVIVGPSNSPYENGQFVLDILISNEYPFYPPKFRMLTPIFHPNITSNGKICIDVLDNNWNPFYTIRSICLSLQYILQHPDYSNSCTLRAAQLFAFNPKKFDAIAKTMTIKFAFELHATFSLFDMTSLHLDTLDNVTDSLHDTINASRINLGAAPLKRKWEDFEENIISKAIEEFNQIS